MAMADKELGPSWAVMLHDALAHIFGWLSLEDMLMVIPRVCKAWNRVSRDPVCWQILRLDQWSYGKSSEQIDRMVGMLVARSQGGLREISIRNLKNVEAFKFIASSGHSLQVLRIPSCGVANDDVRQVVAYMPHITDLDISECEFLSEAALEAFGENCKSITHLRRNTCFLMKNPASNDEEAFAIARCFPQLKYLEVSYGLMSNKGLKAVLSSCTKLEHVNLLGCSHVEMDEALVNECRIELKVFHGPFIDPIYDTEDFDLEDMNDMDDMDDYDDFGYLYFYTDSDLDHTGYSDDES